MVAWCKLKRFSILILVIIYQWVLSDTTIHPDKSRSFTGDTSCEFLNLDYPLLRIFTLLSIQQS